VGAAGGRLRFWDSSALLSLAVRDPSTEWIEPLLQRDPDVALWWGAVLGCFDTLADSWRRQRVTDDGFERAKGLILHLQDRAFEIQPTRELRARAARLLNVHPLRADRALELAAALVWCREQTGGMDFVCVEPGLRLAAAREGFRVLPYAGEVHAPEP
jgi:hypothetical protein